MVNGLYIAVEGGGLGAITVADGAVAFGAVVMLLAGVLVELGARAGGIEPRPVWTWRFGPWLECFLLLVTYVLLLLVVAATLTSGGTAARRTRTRVRSSCPSSRRWAAPSRPCTRPA